MTIVWSSGWFEWLSGCSGWSLDTLDSHQNGLNVHENDHQFCKDGLDDHQKGDDGNQKREEYNIC